jgi:cytochrome b6-f complex iron-sulfur subunit
MAEATQTPPKTPPAAKAAPAARAAPAAKAAAQPVETPKVSRREFLYYIWGASMALLTAETAGAIVWFLLPRFKAGEFGGVFTFPLNSLPAPGSGPGKEDAARLWLSHTQDNKVVALYNVCVHLGCLYKWVDVNHRFECPCHGSKYQLDGTYIEGPAPRSLDRFVTQILDASGNVVGKSDELGNPISIPDGAAAIVIDTSKKIRGQPHA